NATKRGLTAWTIGGGIAGITIGLVGWLKSDMPAIAGFFVLPWMTVGGAIAGGAVYWQVDD
ncbi:MAG TPA: hypothetical protein VH120_01560, partial [Gemmataceae bacterium]|nr:hypothetical protein [Gemmataceae bacterium]